jgi:hypothetical protein
MDRQDDSYESAVRTALDRAIAAGLTGQEFWRALSGADPRLVDRLLKEAGRPAPEGQPAHERREAARRYAADLPLSLPAANPMASQWWFTLDGVESLSSKAWSLATDGSAVFLGAPTVGHHYAVCYQADTTVLDADPDVIESVREAISAVRPSGWASEIYDARREPMSDWRARHSVAVLDPPWYPSLIRLFVSRARMLVRTSGFIVCVIPPLLTRPGVPEERTSLREEAERFRGAGGSPPIADGCLPAGWRA